MPLTRRIEIGSRLRSCREEARLGLGDVAGELKVSKQTVSSWEKGARLLDAIRLADLALMYGVSSDYILFGTRMVPEDLRAVFAKVGSRQAPHSHPGGA
jgi:transcriptional regulator with XRE-family HTH domain